MALQGVLSSKSRARCGETVSPAFAGNERMAFDAAEAIRWARSVRVQSGSFEPTFGVDNLSRSVAVLLELGLSILRETRVHDHRRSLRTGSDDHEHRSC